MLKTDLRNDIDPEASCFTTSEDEVRKHFKSMNASK